MVRNKYLEEFKTNSGKQCFDGCPKKDNYNEFILLKNMSKLDMQTQLRHYVRTNGKQRKKYSQKTAYNQINLR